MMTAQVVGLAAWRIGLHDGRVWGVTWRAEARTLRLEIKLPDGRVPRVRDVRRVVMEGDDGKLVRWAVRRPRSPKPGATTAVEFQARVEPCSGVVPERLQRGPRDLFLECAAGAPVWLPAALGVDGGCGGFESVVVEELSWAADIPRLRLRVRPKPRPAAPADGRPVVDPGRVRFVEIAGEQGVAPIRWRVHGGRLERRGVRWYVRYDAALVPGVPAPIRVRHRGEGFVTLVTTDAVRIPV